MQSLKNMPVGIQDFPSMMEGNYLYVDKTHFIPSLEKLGRAHFLSRPRRFGKSLFLSMLQAYFGGRRELFRELFIEKFKAERGEEWKSYPVLKLDLNAKEYTEKDHLKMILNKNINDWKKQYKLDVEVKEPEIAFAYIIENLYKKYKERVVILVDEYDKPLLESLRNEELHEQYRLILKAFYSVIKSLNGCIHLSFLTGVSKFSKVSIFSDLNNLSDISLRSEYSSICGITQEELESYFAPNIEELASLEEVSHNEMLAKLKKKYDGDHFSEDRLCRKISSIK